MKQFIYLDTDIVNSMIAQKDKGLVLETARESGQSRGEERGKTGKLTGDASISGELYKIAQAQAELHGIGELSKNEHSQTILKEIETKTLHDAAFDIAYEYIRREYDVSPETATLGSFIELERIFEIVDLCYIEKLFSQGALMDVVRKSEREKLEQQLKQSVSDELNREQRRKGGAEIEKEIKKQLEAHDKQYDDILEQIRVARQIIPYDRMLVARGGYLIPLEDQYFRDNPQTMGFKHGGYMTCFGYITNVIGETSETAEGGMFSQLQARVNRALISILPTKEKDLFVVHPIAVYYEQ